MFNSKSCVELKHIDENDSQSFYSKTSLKFQFKQEQLYVSGKKEAYLDLHIKLVKIKIGLLFLWSTTFDLTEAQETQLIDDDLTALTSIVY